MKRDGTGWDRMEQDGTGWNRMEQGETVWSRMDQGGKGQTEQGRVEKDAIG